MDELYERDDQLRALAMRVAALEDNVAFLEGWCEEQQDVLDRAAGPIAYDFELEPEPEPEPARRPVLRVLDLRDEALGAGQPEAVPAGEVVGRSILDDDEEDGDPVVGPLGPATIIAVVETDHDRKVRQIRARLDGIRFRLEVEG
jgi:hypothetical protein